jgi:hypothetical protein
VRLAPQQVAGENDGLPLHEHVRGGGAALRGRAAEGGGALAAEVSKSMLDDFFIAAHSSLAATFTARPPDDRALLMLGTDLAGRARRVAATLADAGERATAITAAADGARASARAAEDGVERACARAADIDTARVALGRAMEEPDPGFTHFIARRALRVVAWLFWLLCLIVRLVESPFIAAEKLPPAMSSAEAERRIIAAHREVHRKAESESAPQE